MTARDEFREASDGRDVGRSADGSEPSAERTDANETVSADDDSSDVTDHSSGAPHVLLLEDDESLRQLLTHKLESSGYETTALADGRECWSFLATEDSPDLVLLDVMVPGLDGFRVLGRIRNDERLADVPVVVLTARSREEDVYKGFDLGADDYVTKPFSPAALVARVRRLLS